MIPLAFLQIQQFIPVNAGTVDNVTFVTKAIDQLNGMIGGVFTAEALQLAYAFGLFLLVIAGLKIAISHQYPATETILAWIITYGFVINVLQYWDSPIGWLGGYNFHQLFTEEARWVAGKIDINALDLLLTRFADIANKMPKPGFMDLLGAFVYAEVMLNMVLIEGVLFAITSFSFIALAIGIVLGPFAAVSYLWRPSRKYWYNWVDYMIKYSLYRVVASLMVFVWANVILQFIDQSITDYSIGTFLALIVPFGVINAAALYGCFKVPHLVSDLTSGSAHSGSGFGGAALLAARGAIA